MVSFPPCKINLGLQILAKEPDGYHSIATCFHAVPWTDVLEVMPATTFSFVQTGLTLPGNPDDNLVVRTYRLLQRDFGIAPVRIHLHKIIPAGAGLGGGSSDAAFTLRSISRTLDVKISRQQMGSLAS